VVQIDDEEVVPKPKLPKKGKDKALPLLEPLANLKRYVVACDPAVLFPPLEGTESRVGDSPDHTEAEHVEEIKGQILSNPNAVPLVIDVGLVLHASVFAETIQVFTKSPTAPIVTSHLRKLVDGM
jgi:hypothetical protein